MYLREREKDETSLRPNDDRWGEESRKMKDAINYIFSVLCARPIRFSIYSMLTAIIDYKHIVAFIGTSLLKNFTHCKFTAQSYLSKTGYVRIEWLPLLDPGCNELHHVGATFAHFHL